MKIKTLVIFSPFFLSLSSCAFVQKQIASLTSNKDQAKREVNAKTTAEGPHKEWDELAKKLSSKKVNFDQVLKDENPLLFEQIQKDTKESYLPLFWGQSQNFDSGAKATIVDENIIRELQKKFGIKNDNKIVHSGIVHTYGYLFSTIETPYGKKRDRWVLPTLNDGLGLKNSSLSPFAVDGSMFSNITYFAASMTFKNLSEVNLLKNVSSEIVSYDYQNTKTIILEEVTRDYTIKTTYIPFPFPTGTNDKYLLIYSTRHNLTQEEKLLTLFPVSEQSFKKNVDKKNLGKNKTIAPRYNSIILGLDKPTTGDRRLIEN